MNKKLEERVSRLERIVNNKNEDKSAVEKWREYSLANQIVLIKDRLCACVEDLKNLADDDQAYKHGMNDEDLIEQLDSTVLQLKNAVEAVDTLAWSANEIEREIEYMLD